MKKIIFTLGLFMAVSSAVYADGNAFTPLNFNDTSYTSQVGAYAAQAVNAVAEAEAIGNGNIQNAISQLENAQVDIRNELLNCKTKLTANIIKATIIIEIILSIFTFFNLSIYITLFTNIILIQFL